MKAQGYFLRSKEIKALGKALQERWNTSLDIDCAFFQSKNKKIRLITRDIAKIGSKKLRIDSFGLYFGQLEKNKLRLSIEGSQIIGKGAKRNVVEISHSDAKRWLAGNDISITEPKNCTNGYVIIKSGKDFLGCGYLKHGIVKNFIPKARRIKF